MSIHVKANVNTILLLYITAIKHYLDVSEAQTVPLPHYIYATHACNDIQHKAPPRILKQAELSETTFKSTFIRHRKQIRILPLF